MGKNSGEWTIGRTSELFLGYLEATAHAYDALFMRCDPHSGTFMQT